MSTAGSIAGMAVSMMKQMMAALPQLRYQPTSKRVQIRLADAVVADTTRAVLIWEPWRIVFRFLQTRILLVCRRE